MDKLDIFVDKLKEKIINELYQEIDLAFITGSYVRKKQFVDEPNINVYLVSKSNNFHKANILYAKLLSDLITSLKDDSEIFVDLHPYTFSQRKDRRINQNRISLTTNMFDGSAINNRLNLSQNIGNGWNFSYEIIFGDERILNSLRNTVEKNERWWDEREYALLLYKHQLEALPHIYSLEDNPLVVFKESLHYAEEAIRDGVSIKLSKQELKRGEDLSIIHDWRNKLIPFYEYYYNSRISTLVEYFTELKYADFEIQLTHSLSEKCYIWAITLVDEVLEQLYLEKEKGSVINEL
nr:hypothetical protein [Terribacillus saccharophilus]